MPDRSPYSGLPVRLAPGKRVLFVSGIDTDAGKSVATGWYATRLAEAGVNVTTQKFIQTGCTGLSIDIALHRRIQGIDPTDEDLAGLTAPIVMKLPASPHLAAEKEGVEIPFGKITASLEKLLERHDEVLLEGAGGLMVPLTRGIFTIDWLEKSGLPLLFVTNTALGSINRTVLSLEAVQRRKIPLAGLILNACPGDPVPEVEADNARFIAEWTRTHFPEVEILTMPKLDL